MLGRRHLRSKVMQAMYAYECSGEDMLVVEKNMFSGIEKIFDLYVYSINFLLEVRNLADTKLEIRKKRRLASEEDLNPNKRFVNNPVLEYLSKNPQINEYTSKNSQLTWDETDEYVKQIYTAILDTDEYHRYMTKEKVSFEDHKRIILRIFKYTIAPNEKIGEWYEDQEITWFDDYQISNTMVYRTLEHITEQEKEHFKVYKVFKDEEDEEFTKKLFRTTIHEKQRTGKIIAEKAKNWDIDRIAKVDYIILKLALTELLEFPNIPPKVTLNEYIELAKEYSTPKSRIFVNGILDSTLKEFSEKQKLIKSGRGLL
ncbi:MAG: transcription antitermination factor NusB [Flavobacteriales bacterium]